LEVLCKNPLNVFDQLEKPVIILTGDLHNALAVQITNSVWESMIGPMNSGNHPHTESGNAPYGGWYDSGRRVKVKWAAGFPDEVIYWRMRGNFYGIVQVNNLFKSSGPENGEVLWIAYEEPQVVVRVHDAYTGRLSMQRASLAWTRGNMQRKMSVSQIWNRQSKTNAKRKRNREESALIARRRRGKREFC